MTKAPARASQGAPTDDLDALFASLLSGASAVAVEAFSTHALERVTQALSHEPDPSEPGEHAQNHTPPSHSHQSHEASQGMGTQVSDWASTGEYRGQALATEILGHAPAASASEHASPQANIHASAHAGADLGALADDTIQALLPAQARVPETLTLPQSAAATAVNAVPVDLVPVEVVGSALAQALAHAAAHAPVPIA